MKHVVIRSGLEALYFSGAHKLMQPLVGGVGAILTLHHVRPPHGDRFQPNQLLEITPDFLEIVIERLERAAFDCVSLDEMHRRLTEQDFSRRFVAITLDDGYRDNRDFAFPIFKKHGIPFAIYVPTSFPDQGGELWWDVLEHVIAQNNNIALELDGKECRLDCASVAEKYRAYDYLYCWLRDRESDDDIRSTMRALSQRYGVDLAATCAAQCMTWDELVGFARDPLVTIGAHTANHTMLAKAPADVARAELKLGRDGLAAKLGQPPRHLAYPYGDPGSAGPREYQMAAELGFKTAVTTCPGVLFAEDRNRLMALPRISINGEYQRRRYVDVLLSGAGTALWNGLRRLKAA